VRARCTSDNEFYVALKLQLRGMGGSVIDPGRTIKHRYQAKYKLK